MADQNERAGDEGTEVQNSTVMINWRTFNVPNLMAIVGAAIAIVTYVNSLDNRVAKVEDNGASRAVTADKKFDEIQMSLATLNNMPYRVGILEQQATAINLRIDRFTETITNTMELIRKDVGGLGTKIEVLSSKVENIVPEKKAGISAQPGIVR